MALAYAKGLLNLSCAQTIEDSTVTVDRLEKLYLEHEDWQDVLVQYAIGMSNLILSHSQKDCINTVSKLKELYNKHSKIPRVAVAYAKVLSQLLYYCYADSSFIQPEEYDTAVRDLESLCNHTDIWTGYAGKYATALTNLAFSQADVIAVRKTLDLSCKLLAANADNEDIQLSHAKTWFNLTLVQEPEDIPAAVSDITTFLTSHTGIISKFKMELDKYLEEHPDHTERYQPLLEL